MQICVLATASSESGALTIYKQFLAALESMVGNNEWHIFIAKGMPTPAIQGVSYHFCHTKGLGRMWFDFFGFQDLIKKITIKPDVIFSLQNTNVRCKCSRSIIYFHQPLPFYKYKIDLHDKFTLTYLFYHFLYPLYVRLCLSDNTSIAVQTHEMKDCFARRFHFPINRIGVFFPRVQLYNPNEIEPYKYDKDTYHFFYPSRYYAYKEHITIAYAINNIYVKNPDLAKKIRIHFTLEKGEQKSLDKYIKETGIEDLFVFHGTIGHQQLLSMLKSSNGLLFPSVIETLGLPLLEAASLGIPVLANNLGYVREVLKGYKGVKFINVHDYQDWATNIELCCGNKRYLPYSKSNDNSWERLMEYIITGFLKE